MGDGLALLWNKDVQIDIRSFNKFHIDTMVNKSNAHSWRFTGFYGDPIPSKRGDSWVLLERLAIPRLVGGDFNSILMKRKKGVGGSDKCVSDMMEF